MTLQKNTLFTFVLFLFLVSDWAIAQSGTQTNSAPLRQSYVVTPAGATGGNATGLAAGDFHGRHQLPNSKSRQQQHWETLLSQSSLGKFSSVQTMEDWIQELRQLGLPVFLDDSARHDSLSEDEPIEITPTSMALRDLLRLTLAEKNATLTFHRNCLKVISLDVAEDPEFLQTIVYDVSSLARNLTDGWGLVTDIKSTIEPESWDDTNGDGTILAQDFGSRRLISVSQSYEIQLAVADYLNSLNKMKGPITNQLRRNPGGSQVIGNASNQLGSRFGDDRYRRQPHNGGGGGGGFGGGGIGGYGLGGGIF